MPPSESAPDASRSDTGSTDTQPTSAETRARLSIGALSRATGIPVETLRTWEARYGFPVPERRPSGHRTYPASVVPRLRLMAEALARGHRAGHVLTADDADLAALLQATPGPGTPARVPTPIDTTEALAPLLAAVQAFDSERLSRLLLAEWARLGPMGFLEQCAAPLTGAIGEAWSNGTAEIRHEHFLSERLSDLLRTLRRPYEERADGPLVVFATLPGETHGLGLQMAALAVATTGCRILYLGTDTPVDQIACVVTDIGARAVALSVSMSTMGDTARLPLAVLRRALPRRVRVVVGGRGAPRDVEHVDVVSSFDDVHRWAAHLANH